MTASEPLSNRSLRRRLLRVGAAFCALWGLYLLAGNVALNLPTAQQLANRKPEKFRIAWDSAYTLWPGYVRATGVSMAGHTRRTVWSLQVDEVSGRIALWPLLRKEIRIPHAVVHGASGGATRIDVERPPAEARPGGWAVNFERIDADRVRHAYFNDLVLKGPGSARASFDKRMRGGPMELRPSQAQFHDAVLWRNGKAVLSRAAVEAYVAIARHRRQEAPGIRKLLLTDARISLDAATAGLNLVAEAGKPPRLETGERSGHLRGALAWHRGSLEPGGRLDVQVPVKGLLAGTPEALAAKVSLDVLPDELRLIAHLAPSVQTALSVDTDLHVRGRDIPLKDWQALVHRTSGHLRSTWQFDSLKWLDAFIPGGRVVAFDGAGEVIANLILADGTIAPGSELTVPRVAATAAALGNLFRGDAHAVIRFEAAPSGTLRPHLEATMQQFSVAPAEMPDLPYVAGNDLRLQVVSEGEIAELRDRLRAQLTFRDARVPDLTIYNHYLPKGQVRLAGGSGRLSGDLHLDGAGEVADGWVRVSGREAVVTMGAATLRGDLDIDTRLRRADLHGRNFVADGSTLVVKNLTIEQPGAPRADGWWARAAMPKARLTWGKPMSIDGSAQVRMKDLSALLTLYAQKKELPSWVDKITDAGEATVEGRVRWRDATLVLDRMEARNERFEVLASLRSREKVRTGNFFASWGTLGVGVAVDGGARNFHVLNARNWYDAQPPLLPP